MSWRSSQETSGEIRVEAFPPCMKAIWGGIQAHVNIPHMGRFAIVTFLHKLGMDSEAILQFFAQVPDFDVNKSRYQIEHITGKIGGGTEYSSPGCSTMQTYGICPLDQRDEICLNEIRHPLSYYRKKLRRIPPKPAAPPPAPAPKEVTPTAGGAATPGPVA
jgi:DNA primase large subunit